MRFFLLFVTLFSVLVAQKEPLPKHLQDFLRTHQSITLGTCDEWIPYVIINKNGSITGYDVDILNLINHYTGAHFVLKAGNWEEMIKLAQEGHLDGLSALIETKKRDKWLLFSKPYISIVKVLLSSYHAPLQHITSKEQLKGKTIAINEGNVLDKKLAKKLGLKAYYFKTNKEAYETALQGKVDFVFGNTSTEYELGSFGLDKLKTVYILDQKSQLRFAIRKELPEAMQILSIGLDRIPKSEFQKIEKKWFLQNYTYTKLILSDKEKKFLQSKKSFFICKPKGYYPFYEKKHKKEEYGITVDILHYLGDILDTHFQFTPSQKCDISFEKIKNFHIPSKPYFTQSFVLVTKKNQPYIENIETLHKPIAIVGRKYFKILKNAYPNTRFVKYSNIQKALYAVQDEKVFGYIDLLSVATTNIERYAMQNLKISARLSQKGTLALWTDSKILSSILTKAINQMNNAQIRYIYNRWVNVQIQEVSSFKYLKEFIILILIIVIISAFWIKKLAQANRKIELLNSSLQNRIDEKIKEEKIKDAILYQQSKLAQLGEMLGMIAHQWRQPLNNISLIASSIALKAKRNKLDKENTIEYSQKIVEHVQHLSQTIDDFRNFFKLTKDTQIIYIDELIEEVYNIVFISIKNTNINIKLDLNTKNPVKTYKNELIQVILNLIKNAEDAILDNEIENGVITISTFEQNNEITIKIKDNGGGISTEYIDKIFDLYFSTKSKNGTGLGLYMSKIIIEKHCKGELEVKNEDNGAAFYIKLNSVI